MVDTIDLKGFEKKSNKELIILDIVKTNELVVQTKRINGTLTNHESRICDLEKDKIEDDAIEKERNVQASKASTNSLIVSMSTGQKNALLVAIVLAIIGWVWQIIDLISKHL